MLRLVSTFTVFICMYSGRVNAECFSCVSNPNWSYYQNRIPGLKSLNMTLTPPTAPLACALDPMRTYADRNAVACKGYCIKWTGATILEDGGLEINVLRGCFDVLIDATIHSTPPDSKCYQEPHDYSHMVGVEYKNTCFCKGFMCNSSAQSSIFTAFSFYIFIVAKLF